MYLRTVKQIYIFNPEHDLALSNGDRHYIPPKNIREMAHDLAELMLATAALHASTNERRSPLCPWGWDTAVAERFKKMGHPTPQLPTDNALSALRQCSERGTAHCLLSTFRQCHTEDSYIGESLVIRTLEDIPSYADRHGHILLKAPLSSSGKGLRHVNFNANVNDNKSRDNDRHSEEKFSSSLKKVESWAGALIQRHGYLTAEPYYNKVQDFAMEFMVDGAGCRFIGYSLFVTDTHGRYTGSRLMSDTHIEDLLATYVPREALHETCHWMIAHHTDIIPKEWDVAQFPLYFGIDMMIVANRQQSIISHPNGCMAYNKPNYKEENNHSQFKIHPCVEINMRMNMGIIAHELYRHHMIPTVEGTFRIVRFPSNEALRRFDSEQSELHPAVFHDGRLAEGYLKLTPITHETLHLAYIDAQKQA